MNIAKAVLRSRSSMFYLSLSVLASVFGLHCAVADEKSYNPKYFYYMEGVALERTWSVGDPGNWTTELKDGVAKSANGKLSAELDSYAAEGDAIRGKWSKKKMNGQMALNGNAVDLSAVEHKAALTFDVKVNRKPSRPVALSMDCGWPCRGTVQVREAFQKAPKGEWFMLPVPLNCFSSGAEEFDFSKIKGVFMLATEGRMDVSVANIRLELLPEGEKGCAAE